MEINYKKNLNPILFNKNNKNLLDLTEIQNYLPLYNNFFNLTPQNYSNFILNYTLSLIKCFFKKSLSPKRLSFFLISE